MNREFLRLIKLKDGEMILCMTNIENARQLTRAVMVDVKNPVAIVSYQVPTDSGIGEGFILKPWLGVCEDTSFSIAADCIMTIGNLKSDIRDQYEKFLDGPSRLPDPEEPEEWEFESSFLKRNNLLN